MAQTRFPASALALAATLAGCAGGGPDHRAGVVRAVVDGSVQLFTEREGGGRRAGSGVVLATGLADKSGAWILTTAHLFEPMVEQIVTIVPPRGSERIPARIAASDPYYDLTLLEAPAIEGEAVDIALESRLTDEIWIAAFPWGRTRTITGGMVSQVVADGGDDVAPTFGPVAQVDATVSYGMSGGGVFLPDSGKLIGLVRGYRTAQVSLGDDQPSLQIPVAGETTVISTRRIACFLRSLNAEEVAFPGLAQWPAVDCSKS